MTGDPGLVPIKGANAVVVRLRRAIETGIYSDGDQLPPERQLALALGTARSTVRKALEQLEGRGLVVRRVGSGTFVNFSGPIATSAGDVADLISPLQLIEVRLAVEPSMARLATLHASTRDLDQMGQCWPSSTPAVPTRTASPGSIRSSISLWRAARAIR